MPNTLIIEDNAPFRRLLCEILFDRFPTMNIDEAATAEEAQQKIEQLPPHLILMDVKLPDGSGFKLTKKIKTAHPEIPIIILTSYNIPEYRDAAYDSGADLFLVKNLSTRKEIIEAVESSLPDIA